MSDEALHALARILLRLCSPLKAHAILMRIGRLFPEQRQARDIEHMAARLRPRGTCLSRALTLAARIPDADVVIGVAPRCGEKMVAHAWLERSGEVFEPSNTTVAEIARLARVRAPRKKARAGAFRF